MPKQSRKPWFIGGWLLNIESLKQLFDDLVENYEFETLSTRALNQDGLENFFGVIRMKHMTNNRPDPSNFMAAYRAACINQLLKAPNKSNSEQDPGINLFHLKDFENVFFSESSNATEYDINASTAEPENFDLAQINCVGYTAGWITRSISHDECLVKINNDDRVEHDHSLLNSERFQGAVSQKLEEFLSQIASTFKNNFEGLLSVSNCGIKNKLAENILLQNSTDLLCKTCKRHVCDKYINMLIKGQLKQLNKKLKKARSQKRNKTTESEKARKLNIVSYNTRTNY